MKLLASVLVVGCASAWAQSADAIIGALSDRALVEQVANLKTDDRIAMPRSSPSGSSSPRALVAEHPAGSFLAGNL